MEKKYWVRFKDGGYSDGFTLQGLKNQLKVPDCDHAHGGVADFGLMMEYEQAHDDVCDWGVDAKEMERWSEESRLDIRVEDRKIACSIIRQAVWPCICAAAERGDKYVNVSSEAFDFRFLVARELGSAGFRCREEVKGMFIEWGEGSEDCYWRFDD